MPRVRASIVLCAACAAVEARAAEAMKVDLVPKAQLGQGLPALIVKAETEIVRVKLDVKRSTDGHRVREAAGPVYAGRSHRFELPMKQPGSAAFQGTLSVDLSDGQSGTMPIDVKVELLPKLEIEVAPSDVDLESRTLRLSANRSLSRVQVSLMSDAGTPMGTTEEVVSDVGADEKIGVRWEAKRGTVMRISVTAWDADGFFGGVDLFPWRVDIPHEEVSFRTGSHDIDGAEVPKLEESFARVEQAITKYGRLATIRLFIAGHTDTVGDAASNRALSDRRARAIGGWFVRRGVQIPVQYTGFGEDRPRVKTADETDEPKNRRAEYIVAVDPPPIDGRPVRWEPLR